MKIKVGVIGIGAMGRGIVRVIQKNEDMDVVAIADRNKYKLKNVECFLIKDCLVTTKPMDVLSVKPDVIVEATGSILEAALLIKSAIERKIHVVTINAEVDQVFGRLFAKMAKARGVIYSSYAGDQHGVLARMIEEISFMGFQAIIAGNNKGFLYKYANPESIKNEAAKRRISVKQCTSFTDGTKLAVEMALVANAFDLNILQTAMFGPRAETVDEALNIFDLERAREIGGVVDYVLGAKPGGSVFLIGYSDDPEDHLYMNYYKMGDGPYYLFWRPYHLCHLETPLAIRGIMKYKESILVQKKRVLEVGAYAKIDLEPGTKLDGIGGYLLYGVLEKPSSLPIGLAEGVVLTKRKRRDQPIEWEDIEFPKDDPLLALWREQGHARAN